MLPDDPALLAPFTRWLSGAGEASSSLVGAQSQSARLLVESGTESGIESAAIAESQFQLSGLHCAACAGIIEQALCELPGVQNARVNAASARLTLRWQPARCTLAQVLARVERAGYGAAPDVAAPARQLREREHRQALWRLFVAAFLMMQVMMMAAPSYFAAPGEISPDLVRLLQWACWVLSLPVLLFSAGPFFRGAWQQLRSGRMGMDVPVALGLTVTFVASSGALFEPGGFFGDEVFFDSLTMFVAFLLGGRYLELRARHRAATVLEQAANRLPDAVERILPDGSLERVAPSRLGVGDRVRVFAGQAFPADGVVERGRSTVDESLLSGESLPVVKLEGDEVVAASMNLQAPLEVRVLRVGADTRHESIVRLMREAMTQRPAATELADRVAGPFLWAVLFLAAVGALAWHFIDPARSVWVAVSVLIVTCPCALSLAAPSARLAATAALAKRGFLLVKLDVLETLCRVDTVVFDKTGTLTEDRMALLEVRAASGAAPDVKVEALLHLARDLASHSQHPFSRALVESAGAEAASVQWQQISEQAGLGLQARDEQGQLWRLGAPAWVAEAAPEGQVLPVEVQLAFGRAGAMIGLRFGEVLRPDAVAAIEALHRQGLKTVLLSGDAPDRVSRLAQTAGVQQAQGGATPASKLALVAKLQAQGRCVLMVGDGINDAPVLARADASVVMGQGAMLARASADALLLSNRLADLASARVLAQHSARVIRQNLAWAAAYNAACIPLALAGFLPPWAAGLGMACSSLFVVLNAQRLAFSKQ
ncbi:heavy metal translocating P-type ATPase [Paucibacter sp. Y2R2-4]|uniref:heavy metal translocating P-type ATPase n=1 Tax=Paucibacter sp. Y2R2-4 TaxID=2893553 RepID=UPI0021E4B5E1|nr:cation-translocating P-type ATPase [Paucibacter sp. Y2R2-4]MCV2348882.1 cadmium-translocating P-type ATPase [Paucibacter sp. Y2R2-4]